MNEEQKLIEEQFKRLPPELQTALSTTKWRADVKEIASANKLSSEQTESFERETMFILYGFENPADYISNLIKEVPVSEEIAITLSEQVNEKILKVIAQQVEVAPVPAEVPHNLPMVEPGEVAHEVKPAASDSGFKIQDLGIKQDAKTEPVPKVEIKKVDNPKVELSTPNYSYPDGKDPYREPLK